MAGWFLLPLHTPLVLLLVAYAVALLFPRTARVRAFVHLLAGMGLHLLLDAFQIHLGGGYYWFFPFSWWTTGWGLFWPEGPLWTLPLLLAAATALWGRRAARRHPRIIPPPRGAGVEKEQKTLDPSPPRE